MFGYEGGFGLQLFQSLKARVLAQELPKVLQTARAKHANKCATSHITVRGDGLLLRSTSGGKSLAVSQQTAAETS